MKFNKLSIWTIAALCLYVIYSQAQTPIWGAGASTGTIHGEFQNPFTNSVTTGSYTPTAWTALSVYDNNTATPGNAYWAQSLLGYSQGPSSTFAPLPSPSQGNGIALFDSDLMASSMTSLTAHRGELISPRIDLTAYTNVPLVLKFFSEYKGLSINELSVSMSTDDGVTWSLPIDYRIYQDSVAPGWVRVYFPNLTSGVANLSQCRLRFVFEGSYYYAAIDDVCIGTAPAYDIAIAPATPNSSVVAERGDVVKIGGNQYQAIQNLPNSPTNFHQWNFGLRAINYGTNQLLSSDSSRIRLTIDHIDNVTGILTPSVYMDTLYLDSTLMANGQNSIIRTDQLRDLNFLYTHGRGTYRVQYWVEHKHVDAYNGNDTLYHTFIINGLGSSTGYISKAALDPTDQKVRATDAIFPTVNNLLAFEYGSMFYFPAAATNDLSIDYVDFRYFVPPNYIGDTSSIVFVNIYRFTDGSGTTPADGYVDSNGFELTLLGIGVDTLLGLGTTVAPGSYALGHVSSIYDPAMGGPMSPLSDDSYYLVSVSHQPNLYGSPNPLIDSTNSIWFGVDKQNYAINMSLSNSNILMEHSFVSNTIDSTNMAPAFSWEAQRLNMVPSIGLNLIYANPLLIDALQNASINLSISPNPATDFVHLETTLSQPGKIEYIITNATGQVIKVFTTNNTNQEGHTLNIKGLPNGTYFVTAKTAEGNFTQPFVKI